MDIVIIGIKFLFYSVLGYYIITYSNKAFDLDVPLYSVGPISPFIGLFSLISIFNVSSNVLVILAFGIIWAYILKTLLKLYVPSYKYDVNLLSFGILNIINVFIIDKFLNFLINHSSYASLSALFTFGLVLYTADVIHTLREKII